MTRKDRATGSYRGHFMQEIELEYADRRRVGPMKKFFRDCLKEHVEEYIRKLEQAERERDLWKELADDGEKIKTSLRTMLSDSSRDLAAAQAREAELVAGLRQISAGSVVVCSVTGKTVRNMDHPSVGIASGLIIKYDTAPGSTDALEAWGKRLVRMIPRPLGCTIDEADAIVRDESRCVSPGEGGKMNGLCDFCRQRRKRNFFGLCEDCNIELGNIQSRKELEEAIELQRQTMESDDLSAARTGR